MIEFRCVLCGEAMHAPADLAGRRESCPACTTSNEVPTAESARAESLARRQHARGRRDFWSTYATAQTWLAGILGTVGALVGIFGIFQPDGTAPEVRYGAAGCFIGLGILAALLAIRASAAAERWERRAHS